jgi:hypothetical protein
MAKCKACGVSIEWLLTPTGARVPAQPMLVVYEKTPGDRERLRSLANPESGAFYINHFTTCPDADRFRKGGRSG